jgi:hypothetical protein
MSLRHDRVDGSTGPLVGAATALAAALALTAATAAAQTQISGATPFPLPPAGPCDNELLGGVLYPSSEVEPWVDVNPTDPL